VLTAAFSCLVPKADDLPAKIHEFIRGHATFAFIGNPGANFKSKFFGINMINYGKQGKDIHVILDISILFQDFSF
jgi:hypothetical protein